MYFSISQVFYPGNKKPVFYVANRGHHADIGGITPGTCTVSASPELKGRGGDPKLVIMPKNLMPSTRHINRNKLKLKDGIAPLYSTLRRNTDCAVTRIPRIDSETCSAHVLNTRIFRNMLLSGMSDKDRTDQKHDKAGQKQ